MLRFLSFWGCCGFLFCFGGEVFVVFVCLVFVPVRCLLMFLPVWKSTFVLFRRVNLEV